MDFKTKVLKSVQVHQHTASSHGGKCYSTENCTLRVHEGYRADLDSSGTMEFRRVIPAHWW